MNRANLIAFLCCLLFVLLGSLWIWRPGIQTDEALFTAGIYGPFEYPLASIRIFQHDFGTMVMTYVGALKAQLWRPVFKLWGVTPATIRVPALIAGALSIWLLYRLVVSTLGVRAAIITCVLLATDPIYIFTTRWDWGPVALQHVLLVGGMLGVAAWHRSQRSLYVAVGFFCFGLAIWDKAIFAWSLAGLGVATIAVFPRELFRGLNVRTVAVAIVAFLAGAYPLIRYNVKYDWVTFRSNTVWKTDEMPYKAQVLRATLNSAAVGSPVLREWWDGPQRLLDTPLERFVARLSSAFGSPERNLQDWLLLASILALPLLWRTPARRAILFGLIFMAVTWAQMIVVEHGGSSTHHTVLLWPMPALLIGAAIAYGIRHRIGAAVLVTSVCLLNLVVISTWYTNLLRNGGNVAWSDAIYPATDALERMPKERVCMVEWGMLDNVRALLEGNVSLCVTADPANPNERDDALWQINAPGTIFITHSRAQETEPGRTERLVKFAAERGYRRTPVQTFADSHGRPVFEIFRFEGPK